MCDHLAHKTSIHNRRERESQSLRDISHVHSRFYPMENGRLRGARGARRRHPRSTWFWSRPLVPETHARFRQHFRKIHAKYADFPKITLKYFPEISVRFLSNFSEIFLKFVIIIVNPDPRVQIFKIYFSANPAKNFHAKFDGLWSNKISAECKFSKFIFLQILQKIFKLNLTVCGLIK